VITTAFLLLWLSTPFQQNVSQGPQLYPIAGVVVDAVTGAPVPHADLLISVQDDQLEVTAGEDGHFRFAGLEVGKYLLSAQARGYVREAFDQHGAFSTAIAVGPGLDSEHLVFRLHPQAVIHGRVTDEHGDPVRHAAVQLFANSNAQGMRANFVQTQAQTDDLGEYRFAHLLVGKYLVVVQAQPWYAQTGLAKRREPEDNVPTFGSSFRRIESKLDPLLDVVYPVTFYPGVLNERSATELNITAGSQEEANIQLQPVPSVHAMLTNVPVNENNPNDTNINITANQKIFGSYAVGFAMVSEQVSPGEFEIAGLPPGEITFTIGAGGNRAEGTRTFTANLTGGDTLDAAAAGPSAKVSGRVIAPATAAPMDQAQLTLVADDNQNVSALLRNDGTFSLSSLQRGSYKLFVNSSRGVVPVQKISASGAKLNGRKFTFDGTQDVQLTITLASGTGQLTGIAQLDGKLRAGVLVLLIPESGENLEDDFRMDQSDSDGTFALREILPGKFLLMAIENGWDLEWTNPAVLKPFRERADVIEIVPGDGKNVAVNVQRRDKNTPP
jgi:Carboxypeptidase regulatory-like domain